MGRDIGDFIDADYDPFVFLELPRDEDRDLADHRAPHSLVIFDDRGIERDGRERLA